MKTIATMALLLGTIAVGIAPAAEAREGRTQRHDTQNERHDTLRDKQHGWKTGKHFARGQHRLHARQVKEVRKLAYKLERATGELQRDARYAIGRPDRRELRALRAIHRLEAAADRFNRRAQHRGPKAVRELRHALRTVEAAFRNARSRADALPRKGEVRKDFRYVSRVLAALEETLEPRRRMAWNGRGFRTAQR